MTNKLQVRDANPSQRYHSHDNYPHSFPYQMASVQTLPETVSQPEPQSATKLPTDNKPSETEGNTSASPVVVGNGFESSIIDAAGLWNVLSSLLLHDASEYDDATNDGSCGQHIITRFKYKSYKSYFNESYATLCDVVYSCSTTKRR